MRRLFSLLLAGCFTSHLHAHDLYLVSGIKGAENQICARIGEEFPESTNALTADRINSFTYLTRPAREPAKLAGAVGNSASSELGKGRLWRK